MAPQLLMGVDIGTYSSKGVLTEPDGTIIARATTEHNVSFPRPGWAEQNADHIWWGEFTQISRDLLEQGNVLGKDVAGVAVSAIGPCLLPVDREGRPLRAGILYGVDTRATEEIAFLNQRYGSDAMYRKGGSVLSSQSVGPKILWLKHNDPDTYRFAAYFHSASDYVVYRLTGEHVMDAYTASLYNPLFDLQAGVWSEEFADEIADLSRLPPVKWATEVAGEVTSEASRDTGLAVGTPVTVGTVDAVAEAVSVGAVYAGDLMCMYGTTAFLILASDRIATNEAMWAVNHAFRGLYGVAAGMATTGAITRWFRDNFARDLEHAEGQGKNVYAMLAEGAAEVPAGSLGLVVLPYFSGERTPINDPRARGVICGLTLSHDRRHVYRAILEGTAYAISHNLEAMRGAGGQPRRIIAVGGGAKNHEWLQIVSDVCGVPQEVPAQTIGASYGDAFLAGLATGVIDSLSVLEATWVKSERTIEADSRNHDLYREYYAIYRRLYDDTVADQHDLAALGYR